MPHPSARASRTSRTSRRRFLPVLVASVVVSVGACSNGDRPTLADRPASTSVTTAPAGSATTEVRLHELPPGPDNLLGYIATPQGTDPEVRVEPDAQAERLDISATTEVGAPTTFAVIGDPGVTSAVTNGWYKVLLPTRPNQGTAWVPAASVSLTQTPLRVFISLADRTLRVENNGAPVFHTAVAVGTAENPTPPGATFVTELIENTNPGGAYGPFAFGLALHSETLTEFAGGPGQVGIHGTNQPDLIGQAVSHGCVRLANDDIESLVDLELPLGVPVLIT